MKSIAIPLLIASIGIATASRLLLQDGCPVVDPLPDPCTVDGMIGSEPKCAAGSEFCVIEDQAVQVPDGCPAQSVPVGVCQPCAIPACTDPCLRHNGKPICNGNKVCVTAPGAVDENKCQIGCPSFVECA
mmetsp:Transcript_5038/g.8521  ORF Transcript_5038/g.8521 Transcript_5038/m.8521 type:complete len:130 (+) Transcript_5038:356-745(+)|eukprot:CAMPEP_0197027354 /NCGR_PEP_ID=MMETSP1384-20130603/7282_1 /TAXON_ID=29189 /ORGANISM="Ammonia sp." /LENGTH=129 /DNA_ID=CAMNT_0042456185 /DNA_START=169 /DNA_END=558 /DNA_ORIENTATION=+